MMMKMMMMTYGVLTYSGLMSILTYVQRRRTSPGSACSIPAANPLHLQHITQV